ncbi:hypothetical protein P7H43_01545 [Enterococcus asini]|uniref:Phage protein n=1 Tax=Enterococcus asini TaxID=57732 RepID=A0AAW8TW60_9ENTE|nr:hypothetical protein [Enterococcus asini]MDT2809175.1 hypothetical protein [Enterococcus asini]
MKLHAVFYLLENHTEWQFYGAFTTSEMAKNLEAHIVRSYAKPYRDIVDTKIVKFEEVAE